MWTEQHEWTRIRKTDSRALKDLKANANQFWLVDDLREANVVPTLRVGLFADYPTRSVGISADYPTRSVGTTLTTAGFLE